MGVSPGSLASSTDSPTITGNVPLQDRISFPQAGQIPMHIALALTSTILVALFSTASARSRCTTDFQGTQLELQAAQQDALANFAGLFLVQRDIQQAFDLYIPGEYINHNPFATSGREVALEFLLPAMAEPTLTLSNIEWFSGQGYGVLHYKMGINGTYSAVMDKYRFEGTCIVEHWDSVQGITGKETNPIAFF